MSSIADAVTIFYFFALFGVGSAFAIDSVRARFSRQRPNYATESAGVVADSADSIECSVETSISVVAKAA